MAPSGTITTVAGTGTEGFSGDGGQASKAQLSYPTGVVADGHGNLLIADSGNNRIRRITAVTQPPTVVSVSLINADTEQEIKLLSAGETLNLASLPTRNLNLRMNTSPNPVGSVKMVLGGAQNNSRTETDAPYALFGDSQGNYNAWTPAVGNYTLTVTPYSGIGATGTAGAAYTLRFSVANQVNAEPVVVSYSLMNADTDQEIKALTAGEEINLATLPTRNLNIRATTRPNSVGSVKLVLSGKQSRTQIDNGLPYALFGDNQGNYNAWTPAVGSYSLTGTTYTGSGASGTAGTTLTVAFRVVNQSPQARTGIEVDAEWTSKRVLTYPNPFRETFTLQFRGKTDGKLPVLLFDAYGRKVFELVEFDAAGQLIQPGQGLAPGPYVLQVGQGPGSQRSRLIKLP